MRLSRRFVRRRIAAFVACPLAALISAIPLVLARARILAHVFILALVLALALAR